MEPVALVHGPDPCANLNHSMEGPAEQDEPTITDERAMRLAIEEAIAALDHGDVPIGAVVLIEGAVVARRHNERERIGDPTAHAEVLALRDAAATVGSRRLREATLVVTVEPCPLCSGAVWAAQVGRVVFGATDLKAGAMGSLYNFAVDQRLNHETVVVPGVLAEECENLLTGFFSGRRVGRSPRVDPSEDAEGAG